MRQMWLEQRNKASAAQAFCPSSESQSVVGASAYNRHRIRQELIWCDSGTARCWYRVPILAKILAGVVPNDHVRHAHARLIEVTLAVLPA